MSRRSHIRSASSDDALRGISHLPSTHFGSENCPVPQTPWRKISNGITQAWRKTKGLGDKTNLQSSDSIDIAQRFTDIVENPAHLRHMKKPQLQSVAVIVNEALPESRRIDPWKQDKEELRNAIEDVFGFPRTISPQAPRRSTDSIEYATTRFNSLSENCPPASAVTDMLLATPASRATKPNNSISRKPKRHSIDGLPTRGLSDSSSLFTGSGFATTGRTKTSNGSLISVSSTKKKAQVPLRTIFSQPNTLLSASNHRSPNQHLFSSSPSKTYSESSSPMSSPLASRSTQSSLGVLSPVLSRSNSGSGIHASASLGGVLSPSNSGVAMSSWGRHSRQSSGKDSTTSSLLRHDLVAEDLTVALLASRVENHGCVSASSSNSSVGLPPSQQQASGMTASRTRSRMSWMGTARFLDVVAEEEEDGEGNNGSVEGGEEGGDRPRKRRREATESSTERAETDGRTGGDHAHDFPKYRWDFARFNVIADPPFFSSSRTSKMTQELLKFTPAYCIVGIYRLITDRHVRKPVWDKCKHGVVRGAAVAGVWTFLTYGFQHTYAEYFLLKTPRFSSMSEYTIYGYTIPIATYATFIFMSSQITTILKFFLSKNLVIAKNRAWDQVVASRGKGPDFWGPYVEEWERPPKVQIGGFQWEKWVGGWIGRYVIRNAIIVPLNLFVPFA
ncbi:hypothetical protein FRB90_006499, partial [Tulasnella sp. 427]